MGAVVRVPLVVLVERPGRVHDHAEVEVPQLVADAGDRRKPDVWPEEVCLEAGPNGVDPGRLRKLEETGEEDFELPMRLTLPAEQLRSLEAAEAARHPFACSSICSTSSRH